MSDLRQLVARTLVAGYGGDQDYWQNPDETDLIVADAVLAALSEAGALIQFPDWVHSVDVYRHEGQFKAHLMEYDDHGDVERGASGYGPAIAAALSDAVKEAT